MTRYTSLHHSYSWNKKWRKVIPVQSWHITCPQPSEGVIEWIKKEKERKSCKILLKKKKSMQENLNANATEKNRITNKKKKKTTVKWQQKQKSIPKLCQSIPTTTKQYNMPPKTFVSKFLPNNLPSKRKVPNPNPPLALNYFTQQPNVGPISSLYFFQTI